MDVASPQHSNVPDANPGHSRSNMTGDEERDAPSRDRGVLQLGCHKFGSPIEMCSIHSDNKWIETKDVSEHVSEKRHKPKPKRNNAATENTT